MQDIYLVNDLKTQICALALESYTIISCHTDLLQIPMNMLQDIPHTNET